MLSVHSADVRSTVDAAAEAEAAAAEWFARELGQPEPVHPHVRMADLLAMADELGLRPEPPPRYPRGAARKMWARICDAIARGEAVPSSAIYCLPTTRAGRKTRQCEYRARRATGLKVLATTAPDEPLPIRRAAELAGLSLSGFEKILRRAAIPYATRGRGASVRAADLTTFLHGRLKIAA